MGKSDLKRAATKRCQNLRDMFKRKKLGATPTLNHVADPSTNVGRSVDFSFYNGSRSLYNFRCVVLCS